ncbi:MAG: STAS domain-containing protein [Armatimonadota bacterium]
MSAEVIQDTHVRVHVTGDIDLSSVTEFYNALDEAAERSPGGFIIDLTETTYIDSAGVQAILVIYGKMRESNGCLIIIVGNVRIKTVLEVVHLEQLPGVCVCTTLDEAKQALYISKREQEGNP